MNDADDIGRRVIADLLADFKEQQLPATALRESYVGLSFVTLRDRYAQESAVDFDLAVSGLEKRKLVGTGPMEPYENNPNSSIAIFALFSKMEYAYLTEAGYREAQQQSKAVPKASKPVSTVHISGTFHNSPVGVGEHINQSVSVNIENDADVIRYLVELADGGGRKSDTTEQDVTALVATVKKGDLEAGRPLVAKLFGLGTESVKQVAWAVISALIAKSIGF